MKKEVQTSLIKYSISIAIAVGLIALYFGERDFAGASVVEQYRMLCDAFFIPAILFLMIGGLVWASSKGAMDGISFLAQNFIRSIIPGARAKTPQKYYDYLQERNERRKQSSSYLFLFVVGGICFAVSLVFLYLFYHTR